MEEKGKKPNKQEIRGNADTIKKIDANELDIPEDRLIFMKQLFLF